MNEADTRAELIDPKLKEAGWGVVEGSKIQREYKIAPGRIQSGGRRMNPVSADYILIYKGRKLAAVEAKSNELEVGEGVAQAKNYASMLQLNFTYAANGNDIYGINMKTGKEGLVSRFPTPEELWTDSFIEQNQWEEIFKNIPFDDVGGTKELRYYQELAVNKAMAAIAADKKRILITLATGTGKTFIAFQIAWKLFHSKWNINNKGARIPRILFLADRNILADQAFNSFSSFAEDAMSRIKPDEIKKKGKVPTNSSLFFTIFQTFMSGKDKDGKPAPYFGDYPPDYFDFIIIDECHRGGANDESNWRGIMEYFDSAVQLGLTATPKRKENIDTYRYFGEPVYSYSLKQGINDGFLTPFKVRRIQTTLDSYIYTPDDTVIEGEVEEGKEYTEADFNKIIEIKEREENRVKLMLAEINQNEKTIVFCATQTHAAAIRDLVNQFKTVSNNPSYCVRVTANDGKIGEKFLRDFQDNEKSIPTILTTSQKLSTGVDARNIRNIVLFRPVNTMIEFKQIIGRGTRTFDGKDYFTIYDFVDAYHHFLDPEWDGEPISDDPCPKCGNTPCTCEKSPPGLCPICGERPCICEKGPPKPCPECGQIPCVCEKKKKKVKIKLRDGKEREIQHMASTSFWNADGKPISAEEFLHNIFGDLPKFFKSEEELRTIWSQPITRKTLLLRLEEAGYGRDALANLQKIIDADKSDLFDVLEFVAFNIQPVTREYRVKSAKNFIFDGLNEKQKEFLDFVLSKYIETGVEELDQEKLPNLLELKYHAISDAARVLGAPADIKQVFIDFQKHLYARHSA